MNNNDAFGCTTFRKGNYLGRSYDFYCNDVASSVLHTSRIEGVRYESIGMSGSSFSGMKKDKAIDGTIDKATMNTLFSSIVDGINENGVAISTLVVPRGDKGITTGTNPSKPSITARLVSRVVMDKAYSAKHAIKLLSELNVVQGNWNPEYELHWMIADANDTYIVETVNNRLSYRGPSAVTGELDNSVVAGYDGQLEADVITNFYISGTDFSLGEHTFEMPVDNPTITPYGAGLERFKIVKDAIEDATLSSDEEAMEIINLVQYTNAYKNDTAWYSEFVSHSQGVTNRTPLEVEGGENATPYISVMASDIDSEMEGEDFEAGRLYELPSLIEDEDHYDYYDGGWPLIDERGHCDRAYWGDGILDENFAEKFNLDPEKPYYLLYRESPEDEWNSAPYSLEGSIYYRGDYNEDTGEYSLGEPIGFTLVLGSSKQPSDYVKGINELKATYQSIFSEGGKEAVRALGVQLGEGASWHSNHQCVYDLANKTMLVYPSENGEVAYRVDVHGVVENEAVEIGGGSEGVELIGIDVDAEGYKVYLYKVPAPPEEYICVDSLGGLYAEVLTETEVYSAYKGPEDEINWRKEAFPNANIKVGDWLMDAFEEIEKGNTYWRRDGEDGEPILQLLY